MLVIPHHASRFSIFFQHNSATIAALDGCLNCYVQQGLQQYQRNTGHLLIFVKRFSSRNAKAKLDTNIVHEYKYETKPGEKKVTNNPLPRVYKPKYVEAFWYEWWKAKGFFSPYSQKSCNKEKFIVCLPPPNVTGHLHLGHAFTVSIQDALVRWHRMQGIETLWVPGCDHAGIATQVIVEKQLWKEKKLTRFDLGRENFVEEVWKWKNEKGERIYRQMERLGASLDWQRAYFSMDEKLSKAVTEAFCRLHERGLIYRSHKLVNWSTQLKSAISDIEVENVKLEGKAKLTIPGYDRKVEFGTLTSFAYKLENPTLGRDEELVVATTRVETMLGDVAVAVHPEDERYRHLIGARLLHPFLPERRLVVIADEIVDPNFGTGAVKITPGHDKSDYDVGKRHGLEIVDIMDDNGRIVTENAEFQGLHRFAARWRLTEALKSCGLYRGTVDNPMTIPICSRTGDVIEPRLKDQWFVNCDVMASRALEAVQSGRLRLEPTNHERVWADWLGKSCDWCLSRQLWWGHRIPAYHVTSVEKTDVDVWVSGRNYDEALANAVRVTGLTAGQLQLKHDEDVLDTWFSAALFPFSVFGWPDKTEDMERFYPTSLLETGADILFFWVARMVMMGEELTGKLPFSGVLLHGLIRDAHGRKMSKSLGNVIDPMDVINGTSLEALHNQVESGNLDKREIETAKQGQKRDFPNGIPECGADALRMTLCAYNFKNEYTNMNVEHVRSARNFCNKLWQAFRFYEQHTSENCDYSLEFTPTRLVDRWILSRLGHVTHDCDVMMRNYDLQLAALSVQNFIHHQFCDVYLECIKPDLEESSEPAVLSSIHHTLHLCLDSGLRLLHPFMPYITEELYQRLRSSRICESVSLAPYPLPEMAPALDLDLEAAMTLTRQIASRVLQFKSIYNLNKFKLDVRVECDEKTGAVLTEFRRELMALSRSRDMQFVSSAPIGWLREPYDDVTIHVNSEALDLGLMLSEASKMAEKCEANLKTLITNTRRMKDGDAETIEKKVEKLSSELEKWRGRIVQIGELVRDG